MSEGLANKKRSASEEGPANYYEGLANDDEGLANDYKGLANDNEPTASHFYIQVDSRCSQGIDDRRSFDWES